MHSVKDFFALAKVFCRVGDSVGMFWVIDCRRWVIFLGAFDPDESERPCGFAAVLGQIVIYLLDVRE
jgi:hypothetical protein